MYDVIGALRKVVANGTEIRIVEAGHNLRVIAVRPQKIGMVSDNREVSFNSGDAGLSAMLLELAEELRNDEIPRGNAPRSP
jgi:hypothetical protein